MKRIEMVLFLIAVLVLPGCNPSTVAQDASNVIGAVLTIAQAETPAIPAQDQAVYNSFLTLGQTLQVQLSTCIASSGAAKSKFLACFNAFASGLTSPAELAQLRIMSAGSQSKVQLYATAIIVGINVAIKSFGGTAASTPAISGSGAPSVADLRELAVQANIPSNLILVYAH